MFVWQEDAVVQAPVTHQPTNQAVTGVYVTGGVFGGELVYNSTTTFDVNPVSCMSDDLSTAIAITSSTTGIAPGTTINEIYHVFAVRYNTATYGIETDTDVDGANLPGTVTAKRWLGFVLTDSSGDIYPFIQDKDSFRFVDGHSIAIATGITSTYTQLDVSSLIPVSRSDAMTITLLPSAANSYYVSLDGSTDWFHRYDSQKSQVTDVPADSAWVKISAGTLSAYITAVRLKR